MGHFFETDEPKSLRELAIETAKSFKHSWIELGRVLYSIWRDKHYKEWGYQQFDTYVTKEIGIRKTTSVKLLRSYYFLEKEEPAYLQGEYIQQVDPAKVPSYEAIDVLRRAKEKRIGSEDYQKLKDDIFIKGKDSKEIRKDLTHLIREREEVSPQEAWQKKKETTIKRFIGTLKSLQREMKETKLLSFEMAEEIGNLIVKLEEQL